MYFECSIKYYGDDLESPQPVRKLFTNVIACWAENYTDAEALATQWALDNIDENDFMISPIKEMTVNSIYYSRDKTGKWFKMSCEFYTEKQNGTLKTNRISFLVQEEDAKRAYDKTKQIMLEDIGNNSFVIKKTEETKIEEYLS